ncbi:DUF4375 domain-containing protein [Rhizobium puerariae]|uniref:DUF4375 domain-containing protein n=1 Tax=Rhizobium puerariae TaxID=1585791 RepID=A0ABV6APE1_9HYPH
MASRIWTRFFPFQQEGVQNRVDWRIWVLFWAVVLIGCTMAVAAAAGPNDCNLDRLRRYPMKEMLGNRVIPLQSPDIFFPAPEKKQGFDFEYMLDAEGAAEYRAAFSRGLQTFPAAERPILTLAAADRWTSAPDGLLTFFVLRDGVLVDDLIQALDAEGLGAHAALLREGKTLFGRDYGTQKERYDRWSDGSGGIRDAGLDFALKGLSERYRKLPRLADEAVKRIAASAELAAIYEPLRAGASDDDRLRFLTSGLWACLNHYGEPEEVAARLSGLPEPYARIIVVMIFEAEMLNGSVHQLFFNSSGGLAPDVVTALRAWGLETHADAVQKGIDMFPSPYPRELNRRRDFMARQGDAFDEALYELTGPVDDGAMHDAMIRVAKEADILPK